MKADSAWRDALACELIGEVLCEEAMQRAFDHLVVGKRGDSLTDINRTFANGMACASDAAVSHGAADAI